MGSRLGDDFCVPVVAEGIDLLAEIFYGNGPLLLKICGVFAGGLEKVFGVVELIDEAAGGIVTFEGGEVFAATRFVG